MCCTLRLPTAERQNPNSEYEPIGTERCSVEVAVAANPRFERISEDGERYVAHRFGDGRYRMADPALVESSTTPQVSCQSTSMKS
jgi:hypothetical protein